MATASVLIGASSLDRLDLVLAAHLLGLEDQAIGAHGDQQHGGDVAEPGHQEERPGRQPQVEGEYIVRARGHDLVEQRIGLHRHDEQQHQGRKHIDEALQPGADIGVEQIDRDVGAAIRRGGDAPEDQDAQQQPSEIVAVRDLVAEEIAQQHRDEDVRGNDADEDRGEELDAVDEAVHAAAPQAPDAERDLERFRFSHDALSIVAHSRDTDGAFPSPLRGGVRGGGGLGHGPCHKLPPSLALPRKGGGNRLPAWRDAPLAPMCASSASVRRLVLVERCLELFHDGVGIAAALAHVVGPLPAQRLGRGFPLGKLRVADGVDLVARLGLHLGEAGMLEIDPGIGELAGPLGGAVIVDHLLLRRRHRGVGARAHQPLEHHGRERRVHVVFGDLVDAKERHRAPGEGD